MLPHFSQASSVFSSLSNIFLIKEHSSSQKALCGRRCGEGINVAYSLQRVVELDALVSHARAEVGSGTTGAVDPGFGERLGRLLIAKLELRTSLHEFCSTPGIKTMGRRGLMGRMGRDR